MAFDRGAREHFVAGPAEAVSAQQLRQYGHAGFPAARDPAIRYRINPGVSVGIPAACGTLFEQVREGDSVLSDIAVGELPEVIRSDPVVGVHEDHESPRALNQSRGFGCADTAVGDGIRADAFVLSAQRSQIAPEPSVDPSSMSSNSKSVMLSARECPSDDIHRGIALYYRRG